MKEDICLLKECSVFYEEWQMACCGEPFKVGDRINWLVLAGGPVNIAVEIGHIDYSYEAHSSEWKKLFVLEGTVKKIELLYEKYEPMADNPRCLYPVDGIMVEADSARGFEKDYKDMKINGYVIKISDYAVRKAMKKEVTFK